MQPQFLVQRGDQRALRKGTLPNVHIRCALQARRRAPPRSRAQRRVPA
jgi:hypothetical protein